MKDKGQPSSPNKSSSRVLGRGLASLLPSSKPPLSTEPRAEQAGSSVYREVPLEQVIPDPEQPRKQFSPEALAELADSIKRQGVLQPLVVRKPQPANASSPRYLLIAGERRWRAAKQAGLHTVPIIERTADNDQALQLAMVENLQREDLNPVEVARGYRELTRRCGFTQAEIAAAVGKSRPSVANTLRLLDLPADVLEYLIEGQLSEGQLRPLIALHDPQQIRRRARQIIDQGLSARQSERQLGATKKAGSASAGSLQQTKPKNSHIIALANQLQRHLATKVDCKAKGEKGELVIRFYSVAELRGLLQRMGLDTTL